ncbi:Stk1 family PASTA domain-containing Ser/Thr kinase [Peribacillus sp. SCS-155]|uniref:Stk1 family PASTA domain-containing Ser/Thr kinase n=1 Tax=Peribacillus sedimenti TaxID=3115297 RepID=UPI0039060700
MLIGKRINGRYKLLDMVGGGGMANVYLAMDMILEREVALKILRMEFSNDDEFIKRFNREAQSATSLAHPNIVSIYDVGEEDDIYYIVMEYVKGHTLKQYIQKNYPIPIEKAIDIMKQITSAISHAHQNGIIHRDIKPQNILIDDGGTVKITDFGIAMALSATNITQTNAVLGSVHYLSPEQARGGMANKKSDIYSLGIVMFELLTGRLPFSGESAVSIALKHLQSETPSPKRWNPEIPQSVENIILKATAKDSFYRYDSVDDMYMDISTALNSDRINEARFLIPEDDEATKAIPIITKDSGISKFDETIVRGPENTPVQTDDTTVVAGKKSKKEKKKGNAKKKKNRWPAILITTFILLMALGVLTVTVLPKMMAPKEITVPDVRGETQDNAISKLLSAGLEYGETIEVDDEGVEKGKVIKTDPEQGTKIKEGSRVDIYESAGKETITIPDYIGRDIDAYQSIIEGMGFKDFEINTKTSDNDPEGTIIDQNPLPGSDVVPSDTNFTVTVSQGPEKVNVEDLSGYTESQLKDYEDRTDLNIDISSENHESIPKGKVISQDPGAGTKVDKNSTVQVVLSKGPNAAVPKLVTRDVTVRYEPEEEGKPQEVSIFIEDMNHDYNTPVRTESISQDYKFTLNVQVQKDRPARYKIMRDNVVYDEQEVPYPE